MSRRLLPILLVFSLLIAADAPQGKQDKDKLTETLFALEKESWDMVKARNADWLKKYATDDFLWIFSDGTRVQKKNLEKFLASYELVSYSMSEAEVIRFDAEAACLVYKLTCTGGEKGKKPTKQTAWSTSTYVLRGGQWKEILYQETPVKE